LPRYPRDVCARTRQSRYVSPADWIGRGHHDYGNARSDSFNRIDDRVVGRYDDMRSEPDKLACQLRQPLIPSLGEPPLYDDVPALGPAKRPQRFMEYFSVVRHNRWGRAG